MGQGDLGTCSQQMMENLIRSLAQCSGEAACRGISAIIQHNDALLERNATLKKDLDASDKTNMRIVDRIQAAEAERDEKQGALDKVREERDKVVAKLKQADDQVAMLAIEITATKEQITSTFKSNEATEKRLEVKVQENSVQKKELRQRGEMLQETQRRLEALQKKYDEDHAELVSLRSKAVSLQELPKSARSALTERVRSIFEKAHDLALRFFGQSDFDKLVFGSEKWSSLTRDKRLKGIHLVPTNSQVANRMRVASVLRILALSALEHIFQPVYLTELGTEVSNFIEHLYQSNPEYAHWIRSILLNIEPETQAENAQKRVEIVMEEIAECVDFLLQPAGTVKEFHAALEEWCEECTQTWRDLQRLTYAFQYHFEPHPQDVDPKEWAPLPESNVPPREGVEETNGNTKNPDMAPPIIAAQIWPMLWVVRKSGKSEMVMRGYALTDAQVKAARDEAVPSRLLDRGLRRQERNRRITNFTNDSTESFL